jgi:hypothetical protein
MVVPHSSAPPVPSTRYPHLVVRLMPSVYQRKATPDGLTASEILERTQHFATSWNLSVAVVWAADRVTYVHPDGTRQESTEPPSGGLAVNVQLPPLVPTSVAYCVPRRPSTAAREIVEQLVGRWRIEYADAAGMIMPDGPGSMLELRADGTYAWSASPTWSAGTGRWKVMPEDGGQYFLELEEKDLGIFQVHWLGPGSESGFRPTWEWRNASRRAHGVLLLRATSAS